MKITYIPTQDSNPSQKDKCPFGVRDLQNDVCYSGNGLNKCPYFVRYDWSHEHYGDIACKHPAISSRELSFIDLLF